MGLLEISLCFALIVTLGAASHWYQEHRAQNIFFKWTVGAGIRISNVKIEPFFYRRFFRGRGEKRIMICFSGHEKDGTPIGGSAFCGSEMSGVFFNDELEIKFH